MAARRRSRWLGLTAVLSLTAGVFCGAANATIVERVVAIVGERPILLSDLRRRAAPFVTTLSGSASARAQAQTQLYGEMLNRMIDEELIRRAASRSQITVTDEEIDAAIERVARGNGVDVDTLLAEVERSGVKQSDYRRELRLQLLDAKVMNLRLQGRVRVATEELKAAYDDLVEEEARQMPVRVAVIRLDLSRGDLGQTQVLAQQLADAARAGADFAELSRRHSSDAATREAGGLLAPVPPAELPRALRDALVGLTRGGVSDPIVVDSTLVVMKLLERPPSSLPPFEQVVPQLQQRVQLQKMEKARRVWLDALRKSTHVEARL